MYFTARECLSSCSQKLTYRDQSNPVSIFVLLQFKQNQPAFLPGHKPAPSWKFLYQVWPLARGDAGLTGVKLHAADIHKERHQEGATSCQQHAHDNSGVK
jgi:hypothetical protein